MWIENRRDREETQRRAPFIVDSDDFRDKGSHRNCLNGFNRAGDGIAQFAPLETFNQAVVDRPVYGHQIPVVDNEMELLFRLGDTLIFAQIAGAAL